MIGLNTGGSIFPAGVFQKTVNSTFRRIIYFSEENQASLTNSER
jgi:hypothetical protein